MSDNPLLEAALNLASRGWYVFPLVPRRKNPLTDNGFHDASRDPAQVERWWAENPNANIGIATGASGLVVLDVDGPEGLAELRALGVETPLTLAVQTGRKGGFHLYYQGSGVSSSQVKGQHLDVRGNTGYVIAPPSVHPSGAVYAWANKELLAPVPNWIEPWVRSRKGAGSGQRPAKAVAKIAVPAFLACTAGPVLAARTLAILERVEWSQTEENRLRAALACIPADIDGATWNAYGAAIHDLGWRNGLDIWDDWSSTSKGRGAGNGEYRGREALEKRWSKFAQPRTGTKTTVGSIYKKAGECGWDGSGTVIPQKESDTPKINGVHALPKELTDQTDAIHFPDTNKIGKPVATCRNTRAAIRGIGIDCRFDIFHNKLLLGGHAINEFAGELSDNALQILRVAIERRFGFDPGPQHAHDAAVQECLQHTFDPVLSYLGGLQWDGQARLGRWLHAYLGADDTALNSEVGWLTLVAAVRRARVPGAKFDQITVLESAEGRYKSTAIEILAGADNFSDQTILTLDDKAQQEALQGVWLYEIADLAGMSRADVEKVKAFASRKVDRARPAFGRVRVDKPRRCVFFATTNDTNYLKSDTGNRRFWPVRTGYVDVEALARDRDQLWAEAAAIEARGVPLGLEPKFWGDAGVLQDARREHDPWDDIIAAYHPKETFLTPDGKGMEWRVSSRDLLDLIIRIPPEKQGVVTARRLGFGMRRHGWDGPKPMRAESGGNVFKGYAKAVPIK